jgi:alkanesulfonate monooxygenase SsuD/methylene tetrahydromethanopterin reductase-like flavin-dependent oxidoreductase (luciferase family)
MRPAQDGELRGTATTVIKEKEKSDMRIGATIFNQNYHDWDRYEAEEQGRAVPKRAVRSDREIFTEEINIARIADDCGFDSVWTIEHHFTPYTMVTNPLQYLTYIAGITKHVDLGTMVVVLPWHNPVRVAEDVNMLDAFLGVGCNVICGVGRGLGRREYQGMGIDQNEARGRFDESLQVLTQLLATGQCDFGSRRRPKQIFLTSPIRRDEQ